MTLSLAGKSIAILAADGFDEHQMTEIQRALTRAHARLSTIAPNPGVVNGWQGESWGHHFHVDAQIGAALGSDYDMLVLPGERSVEKLKQNSHARRIVNHFLEAGKPIAAIAAGVALLALSPASAGRTAAASAEIAEQVKSAGIEVSDAEQEIDGNILTASGANLTAWVESATAFFAGQEQVSQAA